MTFLQVLVEGSSDVPAVKEVLERRFGLQEGQDFSIHPHRGKGRLPKQVNAKPEPRHWGLLDLLPSKLRAYSGLPEGQAVVVLVDADKDDWNTLRQELLTMFDRLEKQPPRERVLFRIAVKELEAWFLADPGAVRKAFPRADLRKIPRQPEQVDGASKHLAATLKMRPQECSGEDKVDWSRRISPHLKLDPPHSCGLNAFVKGIERLVAP